MQQGENRLGIDLMTNSLFQLLSLTHTLSLCMLLSFSLSLSLSLSVTPSNSLYPLALFSHSFSFLSLCHTFTHSIQLTSCLSPSFSLTLSLSLALSHYHQSTSFTDVRIRELHTRYTPYRPEMPITGPPNPPRTPPTRPAASIFENSALRTLHWIQFLLYVEIIGTLYNPRAYTHTTKRCSNPHLPLSCLFWPYSYIMIFRLTYSSWSQGDQNNSPRHTKESNLGVCT